MEKRQVSEKEQTGFYLNKWFLDFVSEDGEEAMIFYAAKLKWRGVEVPYTSWLNYNKATGVSQKSRLSGVQFPQKADQRIEWADPRFDIQGNWQSAVKPIQARLFQTDAGYLEWNCYQPASRVALKIKGRELTGTGYAEQLILTIPPWKLPMEELRWGRFNTADNQLVWIELREKACRQWVWYNGEKMEGAHITDDLISIPEKKISFRMDKSVVLESEKKILHVVKDLLHFLPGFSKAMTGRFLLAAEQKWLSKTTLQKGAEAVGQGWAIHEFVNFNP